MRDDSPPSHAHTHPSPALHPHPHRNPPPPCLPHTPARHYRKGFFRFSRPGRRGPLTRTQRAFVGKCLSMVSESRSFLRFSVGTRRWTRRGVASWLWRLNSLNYRCIGESKYSTRKKNTGFFSTFSSHWYTLASVGFWYGIFFFIFFTLLAVANVIWSCSTVPVLSTVST